MVSSFAESLAAGDAVAVRRAPKADLHSHAYFGAPIEAVEHWLGHSINRPPAQLDGLQGMTQYAANSIDPYLFHLEAFEFTACAAVRHAIDDGVVLLEMSFDVRASRHYPDGLDGFTKFIGSLAMQFRDRVDLRPELGFSRAAASDRELMELVVDAISSNVFQSIDMYGNQNDCDPTLVQGIYWQAHSAGMTLKAHVGEFSGADEVKTTVEVLQLNEVQHGIAASESVEVMKWLADNRIRLHICPTSNVKLGAAADYATHPIRSLYDHGVEITVNTDDLMIFGQSVSDEYLNLHRSGVLTADELDAIRVASIEARD